MNLHAVPDTPPEPLAIATERGLHPSTITDAGIYQVTDDTIYKDWWAIPYPHRQGIWKTRYRNPVEGAKPKYKDEPGASFHLYNPLMLGPGEEEVWFCEGEFDTLALCELGLKAIGIHGVDNVGSDEEKSRFRREWKLLFKDSLNIVMFDNDTSGLESGRRLAAFLNGVVFDEWDTQYSDINDWFRGDWQGLVDALGGFRRRVRAVRGLV